MPVPHTHVNGQREPGCREPELEAAGLTHRQFCNRRDATEELVMSRDLVDASRRDPPSSQDVLEKRPYLVEASRPAERDDQHGVERGSRRYRARPDSLAL